MTSPTAAHPTTVKFPYQSRIEYYALTIPYPLRERAVRKHTQRDRADIPHLPHVPFETVNHTEGLCVADMHSGVSPPSRCNLTASSWTSLWNIRR